MKPRIRKALLGSALGLAAAGAVLFLVLPEAMPEPRQLMGPISALSEPLPFPSAHSADGGHPPSRPGQQRLRALFRLPPGASPLVSISDELQMHQVPMNLASFETRAGWKDVLEFYASQFKRQQWPMYGIDQLKGITPYPSISATLMDDDLQLSVIAMPHEDGSGTTVILGVADMGRFRGNLETPETGDLPLYPGTEPLAVHSTDEGLRALTVSFDTPDPPAKVADFYRQQLSAQGYRPLPSAAATSLGGGDALVFVSKARRWTVALLAEGSSTSVTAQAQEVLR